MRTLTLLLLSVLSLYALASTTITHNISSIGAVKLNALKKSCEWWIEVGDQLLAYAEDDGSGSCVAVVKTDEPIFIVPNVHISHLAEVDDKIILHNLGFAILQAPIRLIRDSLQRTNFSGVNRIVEFNYKSVVLAKQTMNTRRPVLSTPTHSTLETAASIQTLVDAISQDRWFFDVTALASYNRYTEGTGIVSAEKWILNQLASLSNLVVTTLPFTYGSVSGVDIIATIEGATEPNKWVIVGGHYDSISQSPSTSAPGAEDDASGLAAVLEMARVLNEYPPPNTVILIFFSGEEQGLYGSKAHAQYLVDSGNASKVQLMHNMDMIAYQKKTQNEVLLETTSTWAETIFPLYRTSAARYTSLRLYESTSAWGSDHEISRRECLVY